MKRKNCFRCGKELKPGGLFYVVHIRVLSGFDGVLSESEEGIEERLRDLVEQTERSDPQGLEKDVHEEITLVVCKSCRDRFVDEIQHPWEGPFRIRKDPDSLLH